VSTNTPTYSPDFDVEFVVAREAGVEKAMLLVGNDRGGIIVLDTYALDNLIDTLRAARPLLEAAIAGLAAAETESRARS
jgi:hypothetical protein